MELHLDLTKWFQEEKDHISSLRNQEPPLSFLKAAFGVGEHGGGDYEVSQGVGNDSVLNLEDLLGDSDDDLF